MLLLKYILLHKLNSITNLKFLKNSITNLNKYINSKLLIRDIDNLLLKIQNPITEFVTINEINSLNNIVHEFTSDSFNKSYFINNNFCNKLTNLWSLLEGIYIINPAEMVNCINNLTEKRVPPKFNNFEKNKFVIEMTDKFIQKTRKINNVSDFIFDQVKYDKEHHQLDVLSICGMLLSFVLNAESHLYFVIENIKKAQKILNITYDIEEIFSIESKVIQNTESVIDIHALRNAVSHGAFTVYYDYNIREYFVDFKGILNSYNYNKKYSGCQLLILYANYDKLKDIQELFIRIAFLKATLKLFFLAKH